MPISKETPSRGSSSSNRSNSEGSGFFSLPGEIRNKIYDLVFQQRVVLVSREKGNAQRRRLRAIYVAKPYLSYEERSSDEETIDLALLFTSKSIYDEAVSIVYSKLGFAFNSANALDRFIKQAPSNGIAAIQHLGICQPAYGEPELVKDIIWKQKFDIEWTQLYRSILEKMTGLRYFVCRIQVRTWPIKLDLNELWAVMVRQLGYHRFVDVSLEVYHPLHDLVRLRKAATALSKYLRMGAADRAKQSQDDSSWIDCGLFHTLDYLLGHNVRANQPFPRREVVKVLRWSQSKVPASSKNSFGHPWYTSRRSSPPKTKILRICMPPNRQTLQS